MKATAFEFRFRLWLIVALVFLGFWSPWVQWPGWGSRTIAWLWLGHEVGALAGNPLLGFELVTWLAIALAAVGAALRVSGTAYLGAGTVFSESMTAGQVTANGPYRRVRNPLYLGTWFMVAAIALQIPTTGALVVLVLLAWFQLRLILGEEAFLVAKLGQLYRDYLGAVPRLVPILRSRVRASEMRPNWWIALLAEVMPVGVVVSYALLSWQYSADLMARALLISFGLSLVTRALIRPQANPPAPSAP
jgi:protein-S-isoprenylcysteine O-methyltransferase Ste14